MDEKNTQPEKQTISPPPPTPTPMLAPIRPAPEPIQPAEVIAGYLSLGATVLWLAIFLMTFVFDVVRINDYWAEKGDYVTYGLLALGLLSGILGAGTDTGKAGLGLSALILLTLVFYVF